MCHLRKKIQFKGNLWTALDISTHWHLLWTLTWKAWRLSSLWGRWPVVGKPREKASRKQKLTRLILFKCTFLRYTEAIWNLVYLLTSEKKTLLVSIAASIHIYPHPSRFLEFCCKQITVDFFWCFFFTSDSFTHS